MPFSAVENKQIDFCEYEDLKKHYKMDTSTPTDTF